MNNEINKVTATEITTANAVDCWKSLLAADCCERLSILSTVGNLLGEQVVNKSEDGWFVNNTKSMSAGYRVGAPASGVLLEVEAVGVTDGCAGEATIGWIIGWLSGDIVEGWSDGVFGCWLIGAGVSRCCTVGCSVGIDGCPVEEGWVDDLMIGWIEGISMVRNTVGFGEGLKVGCILGRTGGWVNGKTGLIEGNCEGLYGLVEILTVGLMEGIKVGWMVGNKEGLKVGWKLGWWLTGCEGRLVEGWVDEAKGTAELRVWLSHTRWVAW